MSSNKSFRIKYDKDNAVDHLTVKIDQEFDFMEVLSVKITQEDAYKLYSSSYGVLVGRVLANDGFGVPNAKVSIFIKNSNIDDTDKKDIIYPYTTVSDKNADSIRYNLLPANKINKCHQNVGTFPSKRTLIDNDIQIEVFDEFYKYTAVTNEAGDYMIFGIPCGTQQLHVDLDLSDIGVLSQAPRDMEYKGYGIKQFDSPNKFKSSTNLDSLSQIISENTSVTIYPFWGDETESEIAISKKNIDLQYKFEPTCVFMGSIFSDSNKNGISKTCKPSKTAGVMSDMTASQGSIEMIRKTIEGNIEFYDINGNRQIDNNGVWCYQIPMNLDYVVTDEYGNIRPTDDPNKGIPTRADVRFRISLDDNGDEFIQNKTASYLVPNNPRSKTEEDYEFGSACKDTSFVTLMWNKVYSVKNYTSRIQKNKKSIIFGRGTEVKNRGFLGIKSTNYHESNAPIPYNNMYINITLRFMLICLLTKLLINAARFINNIIAWIRSKFTLILCAQICIDTKMLGECDTISDITDRDYYVPVGRYTQIKLQNKTKDTKDEGTTFAYEGIDTFYGSPYYIERIESCIETSLSSENEVVNFDFTNDWLNGCLYAPRFLTKSKKNNKTGVLSTYYCGSDEANDYASLSILQTCAASINPSGTLDSETTYECNQKGRCFRKNKRVTIGRGNVTKGSDNSVYYYRSLEFANGSKLKDKYIQPTGVILLGSFASCDQDGIPQLHQLLPSTTFKVPPDSVETEEIGSFQNIMHYNFVYLKEVHTFIDIDELTGQTEDRVGPGTPSMSDGAVYYIGTTGDTSPTNYYKWNGSNFVAYPDDLSTTITGNTGTTSSGTTWEIRTYTSGITEPTYTWVYAADDQEVPEISGIDWGNKADNIDMKMHYENGLFVGVNCVDSDTFMKSCVNVSRICELGVDFDERQEYTNGLISGYTEVDGLITTNEISDGDARGMFATLNGNNLKTRVISGQTKYDFTYLYPDGFDGRLMSVTGNSDASLTDYWSFRFGTRYSPTNSTDNLSKMYYTYEDDVNRYTFPKFENSFYFYFGLKPGYTALDVFNTNYFVQCGESTQDAFKILLSVINNEGLCTNGDGSINIYLQDVLFPCSIYLNNEKIRDNNVDENIVVNNLYSQYYIVRVYDAENNTVSSSIFLPENSGITYTYQEIDSTSKDTPSGSIIISGETVSGITNDNSDLNEYTYYYTGSTYGNTGTTDFTGTTYTINNLPGGLYTLDLQEKNCSNNSVIYSGIQILEPPTLSMSGATITPGKTSIQIDNILITNSNGRALSEYGILYNTEFGIYNFIIDTATKVTGGTNTYLTSYNMTITGLSAGTMYEIVGYGITSQGMGISDAIFSITLSDVPYIETSQISGVTSNSAISGGEKIRRSGQNITENGVILSQTAGDVTLDFDYVLHFLQTGNSNEHLYQVSNYSNISATTSGNYYYTIPSGITGEISFSANYLTRAYVDTSSSVGSSPIWISLSDALCPIVVTISHQFYNGYTNDDIKIIDALSNSYSIYFPNGGTYGYIVTGSTSTTPTEFPVSINITNKQYRTGTPVSFGLVSLSNGVIGSAFNNHYLDALINDVQIEIVPIDNVREFAIKSGSKFIGPTGVPKFTVNLTGLTSNNLYYAEAYATNSLGTGYGNKISFTTL
jgi:hypothetical protein